MTRRPHAQIHLPPLSPRDALFAVAVLERAIAAIWRAHGDAMAAERRQRDLEGRARHHGVTYGNPDPDPDAEF